MFRTKALRVALATSLSTATMLFVGLVASAQSFSVADREVVFFKGGGTQSEKLEAATGVAADGTVFYSATRVAVPEDLTADPPVIEVTAHTSPQSGTTVQVPASATVDKMNDHRIVRLAPDSADPFVHPTALPTAYAVSGDVVSGVDGVKPKGGSPLTEVEDLKDLATGKYHVDADGADDDADATDDNFTISVFNGDIGTDTADGLTYTISYKTATGIPAETGTDTPGATTPGIAKKRGTNGADGFDFELGGGLFLKYDSMLTDANGIAAAGAADAAVTAAADDACPATNAPAFCVGRNDPTNDYYQLDPNKPPTLWGDNKGLTMTGKHMFTYQLGPSANDGTLDTLNYSVLILNQNIWHTHAATVTINEDVGDQTDATVGLETLNTQIAEDRTDDGEDDDAADATNDRRIQYELTKGGDYFVVTTSATTATKNYGGVPVLSRKKMGTPAKGEKQKYKKLDYESTEGMIEVVITAKAATNYSKHVMGMPMYTLTVMLTDENDPPRLLVPEADREEVKYVFEGDALPTSILLSDMFNDDEDGMDLMYVVEPESMMVEENGITVKATLVGGNVLSFTQEGTGKDAGSNEYAFSITAKEKTGEKLSSSPMMYKFNIKVGANTPPIWVGGTTSVNWSIQENSTDPFANTVKATDVDGEGDIVTYNVSDAKKFNVSKNDDEAAEVNPVKGYNFEEVKRDFFTITACDPWMACTSPVTVIVTVTNEDEDPEVSKTIPERRIYKGTPDKFDAKMYVTDPEGDSFGLTCTSMDEAVFTVNTDCTDGVTITGVGAGSSGMRLIASNSDGTDEGTIMIRVKGGSENNPPTFDNGIEAVSYSVLESMQKGTVGQPIGVSDMDEDDTIMLSTIPENSKFGVSMVKGDAVLSLKAANLDYETEPTVNFIVKADDQWEGIDYLRVTINVSDVNEKPTRSKVMPKDVTVVEDAMMDMDVSDLFEDQDAIDKGRLAIRALVSNPFVADVVVDARGMAMITGKEPGSTDVTLTATDSAGGTATATFEVTVTSNNAPTVANAIDDMEIGKSEIKTLDISKVFTDADGTDVMITGVTVDDESIALAVLTDNNMSLAVIGRAAGMTDITLMGEDESGSKIEDEFMVTVSAEASSSAPRVVKNLSDLTVTADVAELIDVSEVFEGEGLSYRTMVMDPSVLSATIEGHNLSVMGQNPGGSDVSVIATNDSGRSSIATFGVSVETMPTAVGTLPAVVLEVGANNYLVDFSDAFVDRDGDALSYEVSVEQGNFIDWKVSHTTMLITAISRGSSEIVITASDPKGRSADQRFAVEVGDSNIRAIAEQSLAGFGRAVLMSATDAIGSRVTSDTKNSDLSLKSWVKSLAQRAIKNAMPTEAASATSNLLSSASTQSSDTGLNLASPTSFNFGFGDGGKGSWSVWSQTDSQSLDGADYEVDTSSLYLGVDMKASEKVTLGLAVSQNIGASEFSFGSAERDMNNELTTVIPYVSYEPTAKSQIWTMVGAGRGTTEITGGLDNDSSSLSMNLLSVGGRHQLASSGRWSLAARGDYSMARLSTDSGADLSSDLSASVNRVRAGFEGTIDVQTARGTITPFADVGLRRDGGTDLSGTGLEIAGGVRVAMKTFTLEAKGRTLAMHSVSDYSEEGFSLRATMNPTGDGSGLSFSIAPRWGANVESTNSIFGNQNDSMQTMYGTSSAQSAIAARIGYGMLVSNDHFLVTPYVDYDQSNYSGAKVLLGTEITSSKYSNLKLEMAVGSEEERMTGKSGELVGINATLSF